MSWIPDLAEAMGDATDAVEARFDELGEELVAGLVALLVDVRSLAGDRARIGATAEVLFRHVAERACRAGAVDEAYVPLLELLAALATMPPTGEDDPALDPTPDPTDPVEVALADTSIEPGVARRLLDAVHRGTFHVPVLDLTDEGGALGIQFLPVVVAGVPRIAVFTSRDRFEHHVRRAGVPVDAVPVIEVEGRELATLCPPGHGVAINPGMVLGHTLTEEEVAALA